MVEPLSADMLLRRADALRNVQSLDAQAAPGTAAPGFGDMLGKMLVEVDKTQRGADQSIRALAAGENTSIQDVVLKLEQADVAFKLAKEVRNRLLDAYREIIQSATSG